MSIDHASAGLPTWFGPHEAPLFGVVHIPDGGRARAGVVICPPLGKEHVDSYRGLKLLAQRLCARGFAVLRFDYAGTGDSAQEQDSPAAVGRYRSSIQAAAQYLRTAGVPDVAVVGLRAGALLAGVTADAVDDLAGLVLWDPVTDGRRYLRTQRALYKMAVGSESMTAADAYETLPGLQLSRTAAAELSTLKLTPLADATVPVLIAARPEHVDDPRIAALAEAGNCTLRTVSGQGAFVEPASFVVEVPVGALFAITSWLHDTMPTGTHAVSPQIRAQAIVGRLDDGQVICETIDTLGPNRLFAIRTSIAGSDGNQPTLLIHGTACEHHVGLGRVWVESAREVAGRGMAAVRYDRRGTGETGCATLEFPRIHSPESNADVLDAITASGATSERLMMAGVCSGAWNSAYGALHKGAKAVVLVNLLTYSLRDVEVGPEELSRSVLPAPGDVAGERADAMRLRLKKLVRRRLPYSLWLLLGRFGLTEVPEILLRELDRARVSVDVVLAPEDYVWFAKQRGEKGIDRLSRRGWSQRVVRTEMGDHSLLQRDIQNFARGQLLDVAEREFAGLLAPPAQFAESQKQDVPANWRTGGIPCRGM